MNDLIKRQDAIDACLNGYCACVSDCVDEIKKLPSAQQWIPCTERLPEEGEDVLVGLRSESGEYCMKVTSRHDYNYWTGLGREITDEMRWMPLPPIWEGEENE